MSCTSWRSQCGCVAAVGRRRAGRVACRQVGQPVCLDQRRARRRCGNRRRRGRTRSAGRRRSPRAPPGWSQLRSGCSGANRCRYHSPGVPSARSPGSRPARRTWRASRSAARRRRRRGRAGTGTGRAPATPAPPRAPPGTRGAGRSCGSARCRAAPAARRRAPRRSAPRPRRGCRTAGRVAVVGDVVAGVRHRRGVPGVDPERVDAQVGQVGQRGAMPGDVAEPVAVRRRRSCGCRPGRSPRCATRERPRGSRGWSRERWLQRRRRSRHSSLPRRCGGAPRLVRSRLVRHRRLVRRAAPLRAGPPHVRDRGDPAPRGRRHGPGGARPRVLVAAGLALEAVEEPRATGAFAAEQPVYTEVPMLLAMRARAARG